MCVCFFGTLCIYILWFVDHASLYNLVNKANLVHSLFLVYLSISVCFGRLCAHHQEQLCLCDTSSCRWCYSLGWALASSTICLQASWFLALSLHSFTPIFLRSMDTSSSHLIPGLPLRLIAYNFPYIFFGISVSCILSIWPSHRILWHLINLTKFSPLIMASNSSFCRILHDFMRHLVLVILCEWLSPIHTRLINW